MPNELIILTKFHEDRTKITECVLFFLTQTLFEFRHGMSELQQKIEESNKAIKRVEESLSARLEVLEREFRYTSTDNHNGGVALNSKMTRATEGQVDPHLEELKKLEQLSKVYGKETIMSLVFIIIHPQISMRF